MLTSTEITSTCNYNKSTSSMLTLISSQVSHSEGPNVQCPLGANSATSHAMTGRVKKAV